MIKIGDKVPDFNLPDQFDHNITGSDLAKGMVLYYFYPKDNTPGCTLEACQLRDNIEELEKHNVKVIGISADSVKKHQGFSQKYNLPFTLLADTQKSFIEDCGMLVEKSMFGKKYIGISRSSFLAKDGLVVQVWKNVKPLGHAVEVLSYLKANQN